MNIPTQPGDYNEAEWQGQERARLAVRDGVPDSDIDDMRISRALRQAPEMQLPPDFALNVAALARVQATNESVLEQRLLRVLSVVFGLSAIATVAWFGRSWPADFAAALPGGSQAVGWSVTAAACALGNWGLGLLRRRHSGDSSAHR